MNALTVDLVPTVKWLVAALIATSAVIGLAILLGEGIKVGLRARNGAEFRVGRLL